MSAIIQGEKRRNNFTLCLKYSGILFMDFIDEDELLIVEQPWMDILNALPDVLQRKRYGE
jgi:U3 small nucleolar RNA-associated protein 4